MSSVYKLCPAALYSAVQPRCSILSHNTLHHFLSSNSSLENATDRTSFPLLQELSLYKHFSYTLQVACLLYNR